MQPPTPNSSASTPNSQNSKTLSTAKSRFSRKKKFTPPHSKIPKKDKDNRVFLKLIASQSDLDFPRIGNHLKIRKAFTQPNLFHLLHYHSNVQSNLCSDTATWFVVCEHYTDTLQE